MPFSSTWPRGLSSAAPGQQALAERQQVVLVAAGAVQQQQRRQARPRRRHEAVGEARVAARAVMASSEARRGEPCGSRTGGSVRSIRSRIGS